MSNKYKVATGKELLDSGVHFGHQVRRWHPQMAKYIYTVKKDIHIIDLEKTEALLNEACDHLYELASKGGQIIFVGTKRQAREMLAIEAKRAGALYVNERWLGGTITNFDVIKKKTKKLTDLLAKREAGELKKYTKKERLLIDREIAKLERYVGGIVGLRNVPAALFVIDARREKTAIKEASLSGADIVALVDTNTNPKDIDYIIPGNDDGIKSIALILETVANAVEAGYKEYSKKLEEGKLQKEEVLANEATKEKISPKVTSTESPVSSKVAGKKAVKEVGDADPIEISLEEDIVEVLGVVVEEKKDDAEKPAKPIKMKKTKPNKTKKEK